MSYAGHVSKTLRESAGIKSALEQKLISVHELDSAHARVIRTPSASQVGVSCLNAARMWLQGLGFEVTCRGNEELRVTGTAKKGDTSPKAALRNWHAAQKETLNSAKRDSPSVIAAGHYAEDVTELLKDPIILGMAVGLREIPREKIMHDNGTPRHEFMGQANKTYRERGGKGGKSIGAVAEALLKFYTDPREVKIGAAIVDSAVGD
jgi:hypothetical protein